MGNLTKIILTAIIIILGTIIYFFGIVRCSSGKMNGTNYEVRFIIQYNSISLEEMELIEKDIRERYRESCNITVIIDPVDQIPETFRRDNIVPENYGE